MSYKKGKDIKVPFDCLWHCYTRSYVRQVVYQTVNDLVNIKPREFEKW